MGTRTIRSFIAGLLLVAGTAALAAPPRPAPAASPDRVFLARLRVLERKSGGRLGVSILDASTGRTLGQRARERFPMCSTFKALLAATVLMKVDAGALRLEDAVPFGQGDLQDYAPVVRAHLAQGTLTIGELCAATVTVSDNAAANLLLDRIGGPRAVTAFARSLGDPTTRLDRKEPEMNDVPPGDPRDTTSPEAMRRDLERIWTGKALSLEARAQWGKWMAGCSTGFRRLRAGFPADWEVLDKTGTGRDAAGFVNHIAIAGPAGEPPLYIAAYLARAKGDGPAREAILAEVGRIAAEWRAAGSAR